MKKSQLVICLIAFSLLASFNSVYACSLDNLRSCNRAGLISVIKELVLSRQAEDNKNLINKFKATKILAKNKNCIDFELSKEELHNIKRNIQEHNLYYDTLFNPDNYGDYVIYNEEEDELADGYLGVCKKDSFENMFNEQFFIGRPVNIKRLSDFGVVMKKYNKPNNNLSPEQMAFLIVVNERADFSDKLDYNNSLSIKFNQYIENAKKEMEAYNTPEILIVMFSEADPQVLKVDKAEIAGDKATVAVHLGDRVIVYNMIQEDGNWKIDNKELLTMSEYTDSKDKNVRFEEIALSQKRVDMFDDLSLQMKELDNDVSIVIGDQSVYKGSFSRSYEDEYLNVWQGWPKKVFGVFDSGMQLLFINKIDNSYFHHFHQCKKDGLNKILDCSQDCNNDSACTIRCDLKGFKETGLETLQNVFLGEGKLSVSNNRNTLNIYNYSSKKNVEIIDSDSSPLTQDEFRIKVWTYSDASNNFVFKKDILFNEDSCVFE